MFKKKVKQIDPYSYITPENFDIVKEIVMQGLHAPNPYLMVQKLVTMSGIPMEAAQLILSQEIGEAFDAWKVNNGG